MTKDSLIAGLNYMKQEKINVMSIEIDNSKQFTAQSNPIFVIKRYYTMGNTKIPMELKVDLTDVDESEHVLAVRLAQSIMT